MILLKRREITNAQSIILDLQEEINGTATGRYYHRLHLVLLVINGMLPKDVAALYNESDSTVSYWAKKVIRYGVASLCEGQHTGRPSRLTDMQLMELSKDIEKGTEAFGYSQGMWDGILLSEHIKTNYQADLKVRQCQRILRKLGYTLQRPQTEPYGGKDIDKEPFKKL